MINLFEKNFVANNMAYQKINEKIKEEAWRMEHSRYFFFLANGAGAMKRYYRELLSPQTGIAALTLTVIKGFEAKEA